VPKLLFQYLKAIIFNRNRGEKSATGRQALKSGQILRDDQLVRDDHDATTEPIAGGEPAVKRGRGRLRGSKSLNGRKVIPVLIASKKIGDLNSVDPRVRQRTSHIFWKLYDEWGYLSPGNVSTSGQR
jgi:hypothetical protein